MSKKRIGKYVIIFNDILGKGAFSEVYTGVVQATHQTVAIKVVAKSTIEQDQYTKKAFYSEIRIMKRLESPNIIKFLDVHETKNNFYIVLEKAEGTLRQLMKKFGTLSEKNTMGCLIQILNGFGELVTNGVIHRDLKPENILVKDNTLKIADFGFAKHLQNNTILKTTVGTPAYMAPQILKQEKYTAKCDIWSLGVITYEMLVGRVPWDFKELNTPNKLKDICKLIVNHRVQIPESLNISDGLKDFIYGCLNINQNDRFDWDKIYSHPIFGKKFSQNFDKQGSTKISFIMSHFRLNLHSKNININKILNKLGQKLTKNDFCNLVRLIHREISEEDLSIFYKYVVRDGSVYVQDLVKFLERYKCRMTGINLSEQKEMETEMFVESESSQNIHVQGHRLFDRLKNSIEKGSIELEAIFKNIKVKEINYQLFKCIMGEIDPSLHQSEVDCLFNQIDMKKSAVIQTEELYQYLCKIAQEIPKNIA